MPTLPRLSNGVSVFVLPRCATRTMDDVARSLLPVSGCVGVPYPKPGGAKPSLRGGGGTSSTQRRADQCGSGRSIVPCARTDLTECFLCGQPVLATGEQPK